MIKRVDYPVEPDVHSPMNWKLNDVRNPHSFTLLRYPDLPRPYRVAAPALVGGMRRRTAALGAERQAHLILGDHARLLASSRRRYEIE